MDYHVLNSMLQIVENKSEDQNIVQQKTDLISLLRETIVQEEHGETIFMRAFYTNNSERVWQLLEAKENVIIQKNFHIRDEKGKMLLHHACRKGKTDLVRCLIKNGIDVNSQANDGDTALHGCLNKDIALMLLEAGANPNIQNKEGSTPLHVMVAIFIFQGAHDDVVRALLEYNANPNIQDENGNTPLHCLYNQVLVAQVYVNTDQKKEKREIIRTMLINDGADVTIKNKSGQTFEKTLVISEETSRFLLNKFSKEKKKNNFTVFKLSMAFFVGAAITYVLKKHGPTLYNRFIKKRITS